MFIDREAGEIIHLVASVRLFVCAFLLEPCDQYLCVFVSNQETFAIKSFAQCSGSFNFPAYWSFNHYNLHLVNFKNILNIIWKKIHVLRKFRNRTPPVLIAVISLSLPLMTEPDLSGQNKCALLILIVSQCIIHFYVHWLKTL